MLYLLQLVQALKFETPVPHVSSRQRSKQSSRTAALPAEAQLQTLEDFLIDRSVKNPVLGNHLYWYLMCEMEDESVGKMFKKVAFKFMTKIEEVTFCMLTFEFYSILSGRGWSSTARRDPSASRIYGRAFKACKRTKDQQRRQAEED